MALPEWFHEVARRVSNRGRFGADDELGTLNLITPEATLRGTRSVRRGVSFSLAIPLSSDGPQTGRIPNRINPVHTMTSINTPYTGDPAATCMSDDVIMMGLQSGTHWDALAHASYDGRLYNGHPSSTVRAETGAMRCGIDKVKTIVSRGILLDVARAMGLGRVPGGHPIGPEDLDAALALTGLSIESGDILLVRTGQMELLRAGDKEGYRIPTPGLSWKAVPWLRERDVAAVATDTLAFEVWPGEDDAALFPVHLLNLVEVGLLQGQNWHLDDLAADCAADGVYEFLLSASPEPVVGGTGSPVNPVATK